MKFKNNINPLAEDEFEALLAEKYKEYEHQHTAWVQMKYGNTYIGFDIKDRVTEKLMDRIIQLMNLMDIRYAMHHPFGDKDKGFYILIEDEIESRSDFIEEFIKNKYVLAYE